MFRPKAVSDEQEVDSDGASAGVDRENSYVIVGEGQNPGSAVVGEVNEDVIFGAAVRGGQAVRNAVLEPLLQVRRTLTSSELFQNPP